MHLVQDLESHLFGNPHSQHGWSGNDGSGSAVAEARQLTLDMCNAPLGQYECVFTSGATGQYNCGFSLHVKPERTVVARTVAAQVVATAHKWPSSPCD